MFNLDEASRKSRETLDGMMRGYSDVTKGLQAIATETGDYQKQSLQDLTNFMEQMMTARSVEAVYEIQSKFAKSSYESMLSQSMRLSEMYADLAKTAYKPYEAPISRATAVVASTAA